MLVASVGLLFVFNELDEKDKNRQEHAEKKPALSRKLIAIESARNCSKWSSKPADFKFALFRAALSFDRPSAE